MKKLSLVLAMMLAMMLTVTAFAAGPLSPPVDSVGPGGCDFQWPWESDDDADDDTDDDAGENLNNEEVCSWVYSPAEKRLHLDWSNGGRPGTCIIPEGIQAGAILEATDQCGSGWVGTCTMEPIMESFMCRFYEVPPPATKECIVLRIMNDGDDDIESCDGCFVDGVCYAAGTLNSANSCLECNPSNSPTGWSAVQNGTACDDGLFCNGFDNCDYGVCTTHTGTPCLDSCDEDADQCGWCPEGGCVHFLNRLAAGGPDVDNVYLEMRVAFNANDEVQGFPAFTGQNAITRQDLINGYAELIVETSDGWTVEVQKNLVTGNADGDLYYATVPFELENFRLNLETAYGRRSYANPGLFKIQGNLYPCDMGIFSRTADCSFLRVALNSSTPSGVFSAGYDKVVYKGNLVVAANIDYTWVPAMKFRLVTSDQPIMPSPTNFFGFRLMSEDFQTTYGTGELIGDMIYITRSDLNHAALGVGSGTTKTVVLVASVVGLPINTSFGFILMSVEATDYNGEPRDVAGVPLSGGWMTL
ncbi:MAG: hypothetical protein WCT37_01635 [Patescibacteria group bacterium]|jgi:hypothetical protein